MSGILCREIALRGLQTGISSYGRGRPRGPWHSMADMTSVTYLIMISRKYGIDSSKFFECFLNALAHKQASYGGIVIECRGRTGNAVVFLITQNKKIIAQLKLNEETMKYLPGVDFSSFRPEQTTPTTKIGPQKAIDMQIGNINAGTKRVNLKAKVAEKSTAKTVFSRFGDALLVSTLTISDNTGSIKLPLWNSQIDAVSVGDRVQIENGQIKTFRGELQVSIGRKGKLHINENQSTRKLL